MKCSDADLKFAGRLSERREEKCQEVTEQDLRVKGREPDEVEEWDVEGEEAEAEWVVTAPGQDPGETACVPRAGPKFPIRSGHHVMRWPAPSAAVNWRENESRGVDLDHP